MLRADRLDAGGELQPRILDNAERAQSSLDRDPGVAPLPHADGVIGGAEAGVFDAAGSGRVEIADVGDERGFRAQVASHLLPDLDEAGHRIVAGPHQVDRVGAVRLGAYGALDDLLHRQLAGLGEDAVDRRERAEPAVHRARRHVEADLDADLGAVVGRVASKLPGDGHHLAGSGGGVRQFKQEPEVAFVRQEAVADLGDDLGNAVRHTHGATPSPELLVVLRARRLLGDVNGASVALLHPPRDEREQDEEYRRNRQVHHRLLDGVGLAAGEDHLARGAGREVERDGAGHHAHHRDQRVGRERDVGEAVDVVLDVEREHRYQAGDHQHAPPLLPDPVVDLLEGLVLLDPTADHVAGGVAADQEGQAGTEVGADRSPDGTPHRAEYEAADDGNRKTGEHHDAGGDPDQHEHHGCPRPEPTEQGVHALDLVLAVSYTHLRAHETVL